MRTILLVSLALTFLTNQAEAQLFRRFGTPKYSSSCPGGVCPTGYSQPVITAKHPGHWTYPGNLDTHLETTHGVSTAGMSRQQKLDLHDALHEGTVAYPSRYPSVSSVKTYGSTGTVGTATVLQTGGSTGTATVLQTYGSTGTVSILEPMPLSGGSLSLEPAKAVGDRIGSRRQFRQALLQAARQAADDGTLTDEQYNSLRLISLFPGKLDQMQAALSELAVEEGLAASTTAINWDNLLAFIEKLLPIILKLFDLTDTTQPMIINSRPYVQQPMISFFG